MIIEKRLAVTSGTPEFTLKGSLYAEAANDLRNRLLHFIDHEGSNLILSFSDVDYIDSAGLGVLISTHKKLEANGGTLTIENPTGAVREIFELTNLDQILHMK
ncbi:STAS domain-containing protein [Salimicrobium halophilum]|uniref:Anti-sigma factor antagonist n=1 Tax=Salimicrobium halophilum TaxID=86666 RepID=A0A1G8T4T3_9BACI|nr:STAS domain-containing protein [Salimicrobium halophilum]SDJ36588.1 anti-sigma B factor antagonist [Salimicrobium halophilum]